MVFGSPRIENEEIDQVVEVMRSGWLGTGQRTRTFEEKFAEYKGVHNAVALNSCTAALHLACLALNLQPGDEVVTSALTFCATVNAIIHAGASPVLVDIDPTTMNIDPKLVEEKITSRTRALLPVHFAGRSCEMDELCNLAEKYNLTIIEDCAHAIETKYKGKSAGTFGNFGCFSFYSTKNIATGEGGMILIADADKAARVRRLSLHGMSRDAWQRFGSSGYKHYDVLEAGFKYNMMDLQAAIGLQQLLKVNAFHKRREQVWHRYNEAFSSLPVVCPSEPARDTVHGYHLYTILVDEQVTRISRDNFLEEMTREKIGVGVHYRSLPEHTYYQQQYAWKPEDYPVAFSIGKTTVSLPLSAKLSDQDVEDVIGAVRRVLLKTIS